MAPLTRQQAETLYQLFDKYALNDQRDYYRSTVEKCRKSAAQVNTYRAIFSLLTGLTSALAGLIVQSGLQNNAGVCTVDPNTCNAAQTLVFILIIISVIAPVIGGAFSTLADLYQWDRLTTVYSAALESLEVADALSPDPELPDADYIAYLQAYANGTLSVMRDESAQWGQLIRTPEQNERFLAQARERAETVSGGTGSAGSSTNAAASSGDSGVSGAPAASAIPPASTAPDTYGGNAAG